MRVFIVIMALTLSLGTPASFAADRTATSGSGEVQTRSTSVMGIQLGSATRAAARAALKAAGAPGTRENDAYWYDVYDASSLLEGADQLLVGYSITDGRLGMMQYRFPAFMQNEKVREIGEMVAAKYGPPAKTTGNVGLGPVKYQWNLPDGILLTVSRGWPDTTVLLAYEVPAVFRKMEAEQAENDRTEKASAAKRQSKNF